MKLFPLFVIASMVTSTTAFAPLSHPRSTTLTQPPSVLFMSEVEGDDFLEKPEVMEPEVIVPDPVTINGNAPLATMAYDLVANSLSLFLCGVCSYLLAQNLANVAGYGFYWTEDHHFGVASQETLRTEYQFQQEYRTTNSESQIPSSLPK